MDINFFTGFGSGVCLGISVLVLKKYVDFFSKEISPKITCGEETSAKEYFISTDNEYQLAVVVRSDLQMTEGEVATRCSHASLVAFEQVIEFDPDTQALWNSIGKPNITLRVDSADELSQLNKKAKEMGLLTTTTFDDSYSKNLAVLTIGPAPQDVLIQIVGHLKLL